MTIDGVTVYDSMHAPVHSSLEALRSINFVLSGYRSLCISFVSSNPIYRSLFLEWIPPTASAFTSIPSSSLLSTFTFLVEYPTTTLLLHANEPHTLSPYKDLALMVGAVEEYEVEGSLWCTVEMGKYGQLVISSEYPDAQVTIRVMMRITVNKVVYPFTQTFQIRVLPGR